jgi:hypothetical protein
MVAGERLEIERLMSSFGGGWLEKCSVIRGTRWPPTLRQAGFGEGALEKYPPGQLAGVLLYLHARF